MSITSALDPAETETVGPVGLSGQPIELSQLSQLHKCMHRQLPNSHAHMHIQMHMLHTKSKISGKNGIQCNMEEIGNPRGVETLLWQ